jgi:predicted unusual protein kinase regulating ubiquinone biosynthesis (AarF/ABC1/UbiB family)
MGQSLSTRADLLPREYIQELSQLQDRVPPFESAMAIAVVEQELGQPLSELFQGFNPDPLASASLGQVHLAQLRSGEQVVVKVQRPGLEAMFNLDFEVLHQGIRLAQRYLKGLRKYNPEAIYQEFFELLFQEIDYIQEGKNADRFRENFRQQPRIRVPKVYWAYTTRKVLTLEYLPGVKVDDRETLEAKGINLDRVIQLGICAYLKQLLIDGFFQSDPHPGNMAVTARGELIFYDFGTMAEVKVASRDQMIQTFFAVLRKDTNKVVETLIYMGLIEANTNLSAVKRIVEFMLDNFRDKPVDVRAFERISEEVVAMFEQQPFRLPPQMTFVLKSLMTLDGIARTLDPSYNLIAASQPFVRSVTLSQGQGSLVKGLWRGARSLVVDRSHQPSPLLRRLQEIEDRIERGDLQVRVRADDRLSKLVYLALKTLIYACLMGSFLIAGVILVTTPWFQWAGLCLGLAGFWGLALVRSLLRLTFQERLFSASDK